MKLERLGNIIEILSGFAFKSSLFNDKGDGLPLIRVRDVNSGFAGMYFSGEYDDLFLVKNGDLLIGLDGDFKCVEWNFGEALLNQRVCKVIPKPDKVDRNYIFHFLPAALNEIHRNTNYTTVKHLSVKTINEISIPLPSLETQLHIANILTKAKSLIAQRKESIRLLDEYLKSVFLEMFGDPVRNEKKWSIEKLSELGTLDRGVSKNRPRNAPELLGGDYPLIQTGDIANSGLFIEKFNQTYSELGLKQSKMWPSGTLCITIAANIGKASILKFNACFPDSVVGFVTNQGKCETIFVYYLFRFLQSILEKNAPQAAQKNINLGILRELPVPNPPLELQTKFAQIVSTTEALKAQYQQSLQELENLYSSLSQKAFKGELTAKDENMLMAAEPETSYQAQVKKLKPTNVDYYKRTVLAAEIVWQLHKEPTLGHLKLQKLIYLCQRTADMQLPVNFLKQAMGPYDPQMMRSIDKQLKLKAWFQYKKSEFLKYVPLNNAGQHQNDFNKFFSEEQHNIQFIIDTFKNKKSDIIEITATLYACLEEMHVKNIIYSKAMLLQMFYKWSERKEDFSEIEVKQVFKAMQSKGIVPKTFKN